MLTHERLFIGGEWTTPQSQEQITVISPVTEQPIASCPAAARADIDAAVAAARRAFDDPRGWSHWSPADRAAVMFRLADLLEQHSSALARHVTDQNGMPISLALASEGTAPAGMLRYYAQLAQTTPTATPRPSFAGGTTVVAHDPVGVVAAVVPWNYPLTLTFFKLAPALAAGCTVVVKPAPETVLDAYAVAELVAASGLPEGAVNIVPASREASAYLVSHPDVDKVAFTGSTSAGRAIARACGELLRPVTLELGGKSAAIILDDTDLDAIRDALFAATMLNNGQTCYLSTRILAPRNRYKEVAELLVDIAQSTRVGDPTDPATTMGPLVSERQRTSVEGHIQQAAHDGARLLTGGGRPADCDRGWYVQPTVFGDVDNSSALAQQEVFGPVLALLPYDGDDDAVRLANDSAFGLGGTVWSGDPGRAADVAAQMRTGTVGINGYALDVGSPFGGVKASGLGRECGPEGLSAYQTTKSIYGHP